MRLISLHLCLYKSMQNDPLWMSNGENDSPWKKKHPNVAKSNQERSRSRKMIQGRGSWTPRCMKEVVKRLGLINRGFQITCLIFRCCCDSCLRKTSSAMFGCRMLSEQVTVHEHNLRHSRTRIWSRTAA